VKKPLAAILLLLFAFQWVYPAAFTAWFFANRAAIAAKYCENKARPQLHCDGKCFLAKKLKAIEAKKTANENVPLQNVWVETQPCILQESVQPVLPDSGYFANYQLAKTPDYAFIFMSILLRPPGLQAV